MLFVLVCVLTSIHYCFVLFVHVFEKLEQQLYLAVCFIVVCFFSLLTFFVILEKRRQANSVSIPLNMFMS